MTSIASQSVEELGGPGSVLARMRAEHVELNRLLDHLPRARGDEQDEILTRLWRFVFPHAYAEEILIWPAVRAVSPDGDTVTAHVEQGHQKLSELTTALDRIRPGDPGRDQLIAEVIAELRLDVREEENVLLPRLQRGMTQQQLRRLGRSWELVRRTAPHPAARCGVTPAARQRGGGVAAVAARPLPGRVGSRRTAQRWPGPGWCRGGERRSGQGGGCGGAARAGAARRARQHSSRSVGGAPQ